MKFSNYLKFCWIYSVPSNKNKMHKNTQEGATSPSHWRTFDVSVSIQLLRRRCIAIEME